MKKKIVVILAMALSISVVVTGCSGNTNSPGKSTKDQSVEEVYYADEDFVKDMSKGLQARWELIAEDENDETDPQSEEFQTMTLKYIQAELDCIEKYKDEKFENIELQEKAITYIKLLTKHKEICEYIPVDYYGKYLEEYEDIYNERSKIIADMVTDYGLSVDEKYQSTLDEFKTNSKLVKEQDALKDAVASMLEKVEFQETTSDGSGWKTYQGTIENNTGKDFSTLDITINLLDSEGVIVETTYDNIGNFTDGSKAHIEFTTDKEFTSTQLSAQWYD